MEPDQLLGLLAGFTARLQASSSDDKQMLSDIQEALAQNIIQRGGETKELKQFVFENTDLFSPKKPDEQTTNRLRDIISKADLRVKAAEQTVVFRDTPVRTTQLGSIEAKTVAGARVTNTIGPIKTVGGREIQVDVFNIRRLVPLYIQGQTKPAILFNASFKSRVILQQNKLPEPAKEYTLLPDSVWINAKILATNAPDGAYCPLRILGGKISIDAMPANVNNQLTVPATSTVSVQLNLDQKADFESDPTSTYGSDARDSVLKLPASFQFSFKGATKTIQQIASGEWTGYGQTCHLDYQNGQGTIYNPLLNRVAVPLKMTESSFQVSKCTSPFFTVEGTAPVKSAWWTIPAATIDITKPLEADGNGGYVIECAAGLNAYWKNLSGKISLRNPFFIAEPGRIGITDVQSNGNALTQEMDLWRDEQNPFGTSLQLTFKKDAML
ncbi:MAG: hypothetical protein INR69_20255, partial [Mucilaginibacter polytrichastri]|nr:hypothetical protein [Mucilaginibacter polytrichastri]